MENKNVLPLGQLLIKEGKITDEQLLKALEVQRKTGDRLGHTLINLGYITEDELITVLEKQFGIPCIRINNKMINPRIIKTIPENICRKYRLIPILLEGNRLTVAVTDPYNLKFIDEIKFTTDYNVEVVLCSEKSIMDAINSNFGKRDYNYVDDDSEKLPAGISVAKMLDMIYIQAYNMNVREVQLQYFEGKFTVLFITRKNALRSSLMPPEYYKPISMRIKNLAGLDSAGVHKFQEGLIKTKVYGNEIIIRVLIFPHATGENIILRFP